MRAPSLEVRIADLAEETPIVRDKPVKDLADAIAPDYDAGDPVARYGNTHAPRFSGEFRRPVLSRKRV
jgi:hypothetical protein